jgi:transposase
MLSLPPSVRIFLSRDPVDMRKGFDSLAHLVREHLGGNPLSGHLFVFRSRRGDRLKILYWDEGGLCQWYKRLELGSFAWPSIGMAAGERGLEIRAADLTLLLAGIDPSRIQRPERYHPPPTGSHQ